MNGRPKLEKVEAKPKEITLHWLWRDGIVPQNFFSNFDATQQLLICGVLGKCTRLHRNSVSDKCTGVFLVKCLGGNLFFPEAVILTKHNWYLTWWALLTRRTCQAGAHFQVVRVSRVLDTSQGTYMKHLKSITIPPPVPFQYLFVVDVSFKGETEKGSC